MLRIAVVGPVEPFRSGVARHTTALARALSHQAGTSLRVFSFSRQYPALLFPGVSDRADDTAAPVDLDVRFEIDSINPLSWWRVVREIRAYRPDLVIAPMWTFFLAPCLSAILASIRSPIVAVVHNVADHDAGALRSLVGSIQLRSAANHITHTQELAASIQRLVPGANTVVHPHPVFDYPAPRHTLPRRAELELLAFGIIRPYKGLDVLLEAVAAIGERSLMLSVVGEPWQSEASVRAHVVRLGIAKRVELVLRYVPDAEAAEYFARADAVVLPYRSVTGSGVLPLAFYYRKPVVASDLPGFRELVTDEGNGWLVPAEDCAALARTLCDRVSRGAALALVPEVEKVRARLSFEHFADAVLKAAGIEPARRGPET